MNDLAELARRRLDAAQARLAALAIAPTFEEIGTVERIGDGVATIAGLARTRLDELLRFASGAFATAVSLERDGISAVLLDPDSDTAAGTEVYGTGDVVRVPVGEALLGRVVDPLGRPRDGGPPIQATQRDPIERAAPAIVERDAVREPLLTGLLAVDTMVPLGRGQRELIIGDRATGKTAIAVDAILNQRRSDVVCVYASVGQKASTVERIVETVRRAGPFERCIFVLADASDPPGLQWISPFAACTMAEYFRDRGAHALLVVDDLTKHAAIHRQLALLLRHPPGREAYPGDIFYLHARLLERAAKLSAERGGGSLSALPIAETQAGNISAYIPTNLISITDGQIYLEPKLFNEGQKPAINVGLSVSRVGGRTQPAAFRDLAPTLKLDYAQFIELEAFMRFGQAADSRTQRALGHGQALRAVLRQPQGQPLAVATQIALLLALREGVLERIGADGTDRLKHGLEEALGAELPHLFERVEATLGLGAEDRAALLAWLRRRAGLS